jgi:anti-sigma-K factor RskA
MTDPQVVDRLARIETRLEVYNELLKNHIKRTELLESEVHSLWRWKFWVAGAIVAVITLVQLLVKFI